MSFTVERLEFYLLIAMRVSAFVLTAPFFSYRSVPVRVKGALSIMLSIILIQITPAVTISYSGVLGFSALVLKEAAIGAILGFLCNMCFYIVSFAGQLIDIEMGLSMANMFDPATNIQVTVTGNIYNYAVMLMMVATNMHYYVIRAIADTFKYFNVGATSLKDGLLDVMLDFMVNYFIIAVRIVLPVFACMLLINVVLGVLTKAAPQMNMFSIGIQVKVLVGIVILLILVQTLPMVSNYIFDEMKNVATNVINVLKP